MKPSAALTANRAEIRRIVESHRAGNTRVLGSVAQGVDTESSDLDLATARHLPSNSGVNPTD